MQSIQFRGVEISSDSEYYVLNSVEPNEIDVDMQETKVLERDGATYTNLSYNSRRVKISGTICADNADELPRLRTKLINAFDGKTLDTVVYMIDKLEYHADCIGSVMLPPPEGLCQEFSISLILPKFFWCGKTYEHHIKGLSSRTFTSKLKENVPFRTAIAFTVTDSDGNSFAADRIDKYIAAMTDDNYISLSTKTNIQGVDTGIIKLRYIPHDGEVITIDSDDMTVVSSLNGNLNKYLIAFDKLLINSGSNCVNYSGNVVEFVYNKSSSLESISNVVISIVVEYDVTYSKKCIGV